MRKGDEGGAEQCGKPRASAELFERILALKIPDCERNIRRGGMYRLRWMALTGSSPKVSKNLADWW